MLTETWLGFPLWSWLLFVAAIILALAILLARTLEFEGVNFTATPPFVTFRFKRRRKDATPPVTRDVERATPHVAASGSRSVAIGGSVSDTTIITGDVHLPPPEKPPRESAAPPARTAHYVHRGKIENDVRAALHARANVAVVGVAGMGGIGKTELAKQLCGELAARERVIWLGVYDRPLVSLQDELARALGITLDPRADAASRYDTLRAAFAHNPCIVFFDDVYKSAVPHLQYLLPPSPPCAALITSRQRELGVTTRLFQLDVMTEAQALELLREAHGLGDVIAREPDAARKLCELCGYLPLALDLAASRLRKQLHLSETPIAQFNKLLTNRLRELERTHDPDPHLRSITANIALSYDALDTADQRRLRALAVFAPSGFAPRAVAAVWRENAADARRHLERLQDESLVMNAEKVGRLRLHDLVRDFAMQELDARGESDAPHRAHAEFLLALFKKHYTDDLSTAPEVSDELENLREAALWAREQREGELLARLATVPRNWLMIFSVWEEWQAWLDAALRLGIDDDPQLKANVLKAMGDVQQFRNERDAALTSYGQALELYRAVGSKLGEANVLKAMGDVQQFRNERDAALTSYGQALELYRAVGERLGEANVLKAMGDVQQFRDERDAALTSYGQALELYRAVGAKLGEANVLQRIGDVQQFRKEMDAALTSYRQALELYRAVGDRLGEANVLQRIGDVQQFRKEMDAALTSYGQALELFRAVGDRLGEANVLKAMGDVQQFRKEMDAALTSYGQALELYRAVGDRLGEANVLAAQSRLLVASGNLSQAEQMLAQAIAIRREIRSLYDEGVDYGNFALALLRVGERAKAKTYALQAKTVLQKIDEPSLLEWVERLIAACG